MRQTRRHRVDVWKGAVLCHLLLWGRGARSFSPREEQRHPQERRGDAARREKEVFVQLGYVPCNFMDIVARTATNEPLVLQTYPLNGGSARRQAKARLATDEPETAAVGVPFPTLYWLCHAEIGKAVADLERRGYVKDIDAQIRASAHLSQLMGQCHAEYAQTRWSSISTQDVLRLTPRMRLLLKDSGIAGSNLTVPEDLFPSVKCLHAHYAHYRVSLVNPVGKMVHELLQQDYPELVL